MPKAAINKGYVDHVLSPKQIRNKYEILIAKDDPVFFRRLEVILTKWGYEVVSCVDGIKAWEILQGENTPKLAVLDWMMPGMEGIELCRKVRKQIREPYIYILLLTSKDGKDDIVEGIEAGADDYITKPFYTHELKARLRAGMRIIKSQAKLIDARNEHEIKATHDALTDTWNRAAIIDILIREIERSKHENTKLSVLMIEIDSFKHINDNFGHSAGDVVICETVKRLLIKLRPYDCIGRFGESKFLVVMPGNNGQVVSNLAERLRISICEYPISTNEGLINISISIGVCGI